MMWWLWPVAAVVLLFGFVVFRGAPYVPSKKKELDNIFANLYPLSAKDTLVDIGSGDGIVLRAASRRGARAVGYELNPVLVAIAQLLARGDTRTSITWADFWRRELPAGTTVVYVFGESRDIRRMAAKVQDAADTQQRPIALISYGFEIPGYEAERSLGAHHLYRIIPLR
jgi:hypothetical protein